MGMLNNPWFRVKIAKTVDPVTGNVSLQFEHPTLAGIATHTTTISTVKVEVNHSDSLPTIGSTRISPHVISVFVSSHRQSERRMDA